VPSSFAPASRPMLIALCVVFPWLLLMLYLGLVVYDVQ